MPALAVGRCDGQGLTTGEGEPMNLSRTRRWRMAVGGLTAAGMVAVSGMVPGVASGAPRPVSAVTMDVGVYNVYLGADLNPLFGASSLPDLIARAGGIYAEVERTDFPQRAEAIADLVADDSPDVLGLNEVALWETAPWTFVQTPSGQLPVTTGPYTPSFDFEQILLDALAAEGEPYTVVATNSNFTSAAIPIAI